MKPNNFSEELLDCIFAAMMGNDGTKVYYNKDQKDVQQEVQGYLSSHMAEDQTTENRILANRIVNSDKKDTIVDGIHYLIPTLQLTKFLEVFSKNANEHIDLLQFVREFEGDISKEYHKYTDSIQNIMFNISIEELFLQKLDKWYNANNFDIDLLMGIWKTTRKEIVLNFLESITHVDGELIRFNLSGKENIKREFYIQDKLVVVQASISPIENNKVIYFGKRSNDFPSTNPNREFTELIQEFFDDIAFTLQYINDKGYNIQIVIESLISQCKLHIYKYKRLIDGDLYSYIDKLIICLNAYENTFFKHGLNIEMENRLRSNCTDKCFEIFKDSLWITKWDMPNGLRSMHPFLEKYK